MTWDGRDLSLLPGAEIGLEDSKLIRRLLEQGSVTVSFTLDNKTSGRCR